MKTDNWTGSATWQSKVLSQRSSSKRFPRPSHSPIVKSAKLLVFTLQAILGHETLDMVRRYLAIAQTDIDGVHQRASPVKVWGL